MRLVYISGYYKPANVYGGTVTSISTAFEAMAKLGVQVDVLTTNANGRDCLNVPLRQRVNMDGVGVWYYPKSNLLKSISISGEMVHEFHQRIHQYDLVISGLLWQPIVENIRLSCISAKVPYIVLLFGQLMPWALHYKYLRKRLFLKLLGWRFLNSATALQCTSQIEAYAVTNLSPKPPCLVIPHGLNIESFNSLPERGKTRSMLGIPDSDIVLICLGRLHRVKNPELSLEAFAALNRSDIHLIYAGPDEGGFEPLLRNRAKEIGCSEKVHFTGLLDKSNVMQILVDADLLVMPSEQENFGMSAAEALAAGIPILTSDKVPMGIYASHVKAGLIAPISVSHFTKALQDLLSDRVHLKQMGNRGKALIKQEFDSKTLAMRTINVYQSLVDGYSITYDSLIH